MRLRKRESLADYRWIELATYNAERARGIVHTSEWQERMRLEQEAFDREQGRLVNRRYSPPPPLPKVIKPPATERRGI